MIEFWFYVVAILLLCVAGCVYAEWEEHGHVWKRRRQIRRARRASRRRHAR
jgi:uncharacterized integral membrane protein